jgi:hypothetical protein
MSDSNNSRPVVSGQVASWLGVIAFVAVAVAVIAYAYLAFRSPSGVDADHRLAQKALRADLDSKAKGLLADSGRNADGTYHIPIESSIALIAAKPEILAQLRQPITNPGEAPPAPVFTSGTK